MQLAAEKLLQVSKLAVVQNEPLKNAFGICFRTSDSKKNRMCLTSFLHGISETKPLWYCDMFSVQSLKKSCGDFFFLYRRSFWKKYLREDLFSLILTICLPCSLSDFILPFFFFRVWTRIRQWHQWRDRLSVRKPILPTSHIASPCTIWMVCWIITPLKY